MYFYLYPTKIKKHVNVCKNNLLVLLSTGSIIYLHINKFTKS